MKIKISSVKSADVYDNSLYYTTDNQLALIKFIIQKRVSKIKTSSMSDKDLQNYSKMDEEMKKAEHLIDYANNLLSEYENFSNKINNLVNNLSESRNFDLDRIRKKVFSDAKAQLTEVIRILEKYGENYKCHYRISGELPSYDEYGNEIEKGKYILKGKPGDSNYYTYVDSLLSDFGIRKGHESEIINQAHHTFSSFYLEKNAKKVNAQNSNKINQMEMIKGTDNFHPWIVPEIGKIDDLMRKTESQKDRNKLSSARKEYVELQNAKFNLYNCQELKHIIESLNYTSKYFDSFAKTLPALEERYKKEVQRCEEKINDKSFDPKKKEVEKIEQEINKQGKIDDLRQQIKNKEEIVKRLIDEVENLRKNQSHLKFIHDTKEAEAYKTKYVEEKVVEVSTNRAPGDGPVDRKIIPEHQEYIHDEKTRDIIVGHSKEDLVASQEQLEKAEASLRMHENELQKLKDLENRLELEKEQAKQEYKEKSFLEKAKEKMRKNKLSSDSSIKR